MTRRLHHGAICLVWPKWLGLVVALGMQPASALSDRPAELGTGWWTGTVTLEHGPMQFFLEVARAGPLPPQIMVHTEAAVTELVASARESEAITLFSTQPGERMEGTMGSSGLFLGRYYPAVGGPAGGFPFRARPTEPWEPVPPLKVWNLTGVWELQTGPLDRVEVVLAHRDHRLHAIWREPNGTVRYLSGRLDGQRFALEMWRESRVVFGQYSPDGVLRGRWSDAQGNITSFQMTRKTTRR